MDSPHEPRSTAEPAAPGDLGSDEAVVAYLRSRAPGPPVVWLDARAVTVRARDALRRLRRRRVRTAIAAAVGTVTVYVALVFVGPLVPLPAGGVNVPGGAAIRGAVARLLPGMPPGPDEWQEDVDALGANVLPVVERLQVSYYLKQSGCRVLEYARGNYRDGDPECQDLVPFDAQARADFEELTDAIERSGVVVERIFGDADRVHVQVPDSSWQYNWDYAYAPDIDTAPAPGHPSELWTRIGDGWWFHRAHDD
jgi:hypothetical protein